MIITKLGQHNKLKIKRKKCSIFLKIKVEFIYKTFLKKF